MNKITCCLLLCLGLAHLPSFAQRSIDEKVDSLLALMTLKEKVGQMNQYNGFWDVTGPVPEGRSAAQKYERIRKGYVGSMLNVNGVEETRTVQKLAVEESRLGIPLIFGYDVIHGYQTMFPIPLGEAASWDPAALSLSARVAATEATAAGIHWTFAPMMDVTREPRWGRIMESGGEDPYLGARAAAARIRGFQGEDLGAPNTLAACSKHFAAYGFPDGGRDYNSVNIGPALLHDIVLPPFKAAAEAGVATFMNAFNTLDGIPATGHHYLQRELLKGKWGWEGFILSDWASIREMIPHGVAANEREAARLAVEAGCDMDMESYAYFPHLVDLVREGVVDEGLIDEAAGRILRLKFQVGLFDDPYRYCNPEREKNEILSAVHLEASRDVARKSVVLLKNEGDFLPLSPQVKSVAVIGPLADDKDVPLGSWRGKAITGSAVSLLEGVKAAVGRRTKVLHAQGYQLTKGERGFTIDLTINEDDTTGIGAAVAVARQAEVVIMALGEDCWQSGEGRSRTTLDLPGRQEELLAAVRAVNPNIVLVLMNGRPLVLTDLAPQVPALVEGWFLGSQAGHALADVLFGAYNPSGKLPVSFPRTLGQVPIYYNHLNTGRSESEGNPFWSHYIDASNEPLYPFGFGLSYTRFSYANLTVSREAFNQNEALVVSFTLTNTGKVAGAEVAQLYVRDRIGSRSRPVKELKGFQKVMLQPGESQQVTFTLTANDLAFYTRSGEWTAEPGEFELMVGGSSESLPLKTVVELK